LFRCRPEALCNGLVPFVWQPAYVRIVKSFAGGVVAEDRPFGGHPGAVRALAFSPDNKALASGGDDGIVLLWEAGSGEQRGLLTGHTGAVLAVAFSPDGATLASGGDDGIVVLWEAASGDKLASLSGHTGAVLAVAFSPDGATLASGGNDGTVLLWEVAGGELRANLTNDVDAVASLAFNPVDATLASAGPSPDGTGIIHFWDVHDNRLARSLVDDTGAISAVAFSRDGTTLASAGIEGRVQVWDTFSGESRPMMTGHSGLVTGVAFSMDGQTLASAGADGSVRLWDAKSDDLQRIITGHSGQVTAVAFRPDGQTLASAGADGTIRLWDAYGGDLQRTMTGHAGWVTALAFSPDGATLASGGADGTVRLWDAEGGELRRTLAGHTNTVIALAFSSDGAMMASVDVDGPIRLWDTDSGENRQRLSGHSPWTVAVAFSPDGATLASVGADRTVRLWDSYSGEVRKVLTGHTDLTVAVAFSRDGATLVSAGSNGMVWFWDACSGAPVRQFTTLAGSAFPAVLSADVATLASAGDHGDVRLLDIDSAEQRLLLTNYKPLVSALTFSRDGLTLASAGDDGTVRLWDVGTGEYRRTLTGHTAFVSAVSFSPNGEILASAGHDHTIRMWDPLTGRQVAGTGFGARHKRMRALAGIGSDQPSIEDRLDFHDDAETLAELVAAMETEAPLSVALLGEWGSGKSSLMRQMQKEVQRLADLSLNNLGRSSFAANVRQVRFNAWHYSDDRLWAGLIEHLFRELATPQGQTPTDPTVADMGAERKRLHDRVDALHAQDEQLTAGLSGFDQARLAAFRPPLAYVHLAAAATRGLLRDIRTYIRLLVAWTIVSAVFYGVWETFGHEVARAIGAIGVVTAPALVVFHRLHEWQRDGEGVVARVRGKLERLQQEVQTDLVKDRARLAEVDAALRLSEFLSERSGTAAYEQFRGLLGQVRRDLKKLEVDLQEARSQWEESPNPTPPLERIILYVDDLDRCPPERVVEVLAAVHLMLALPLFVVVVAVDPRWLLGSLRHHYAELFAGPLTGVEGHFDLATPLDYLDKIFQIPFAVGPLTAKVSAQYLTALVRPEQAEQIRSGSLFESKVRTAGNRGPSGATPDNAGTTHELHLPAKPAAAADKAIPSLLLAVHPASARLLPRPGEPGATAAIDLRAHGLELHDSEVDFLPVIAPLLPTPRAAKKLVNLYRLIRIGIKDRDLPQFLDRQTYKAVLLLLALIVGAPADAQPILVAIVSAPDAAGLNLADLLDKDTPVGVTTAEWAATRKTRGQIRDLLRTLSTGGDPNVPTDVAVYRRLCPTVARFSFYTRNLMTDRVASADPEACTDRANETGSIGRPGASL
jgi:WD40 repeat protein